MEKDLSVSEKKTLKNKERAGRAGEAAWGQGRQRGPLWRRCARPRRGFAWELSAFPAGKGKDPHALTTVCEGCRERYALSDCI